MDIDILFENIIKNKFVLWIGSGFSIDAGYPSGKNLANSFFKEFNTILKNEDRELTLDDVTDKIYNCLQSKQPIITHLAKEFQSVQRNNPTIHEKLKLNPFIKDIITTNYDTLLEDAYNNHSHNLICNIKELSTIPNNKKVNIYKIHGDLLHQEDIIITKTDYNNFYKNRKDTSLFWSNIKSIATSRSIIFIGYSLSDPNIIDIIDALNTELGELRKPIYLIAPNFQSNQIKKLKEKKIHYINNTGNYFVDNFQEYIYTNFHKFLYDDVHTDESAEILKQKNIFVNYTNKGDSCLQFDSVILDEFQEAKVTLSFNNRTVPDLEKNVDSPIEIKKEDLNKFNLSIGEINILTLDNLESITIVSNPTFDDLYLEVPIEKFTINTLKMAVLLCDDGFILKIKHITCKIDIKLSMNKLKLDFEFDQDSFSLFHYYEFFRTISLVLDNEQIKVCFKDQNLRFNIGSLFPTLPQVEFVNLYSDVLKKLKDIANYFQITFGKFKLYELSDKNVKHIDRLYRYINFTPGDSINFTDMEYIVTDNKIFNIYKINESINNLKLVLKEESFRIFNQKFSIKNKHIICNDAFLKEKKQIGDNNVFLISSRSGNCNLFFDEIIKQEINSK